MSRRQSGATPPPYHCLWLHALQGIEGATASVLGMRPPSNRKARVALRAARAMGRRAFPSHRSPRRRLIWPTLFVRRIGLITGDFDGFHQGAFAAGVEYEAEEVQQHLRC